MNASEHEPLAALLEKLQPLLAGGRLDNVVDLLSLLGGAQGWSPAQGWIMRGAVLSVCGMGNLSCAFESAEGRLDVIMRALDDAARD